MAEDAMELKLGKWGNSVGVRLDKDALAALGGLGAGDSIFLVRTSEGWKITPYDPDFAEQMHAARSIMRRRRAALRELAK
jgi:putative addiction module antidote